MQIGQFILGKNLGIGAFGKVRQDDAREDPGLTLGGGQAQESLASLGVMVDCCLGWMDGRVCRTNLSLSSALDDDPVSR